MVASCKPSYNQTDFLPSLHGDPCNQPVHFYHIIVQHVLVSGTIIKVLDVGAVWDLQVAILRDDMVKGELEANVVP